MNYENFKTGFNKHAIFTAETYGTKTTVEIDHSDLSLDEVMDAFKTLIVGMGYNMDSFNQWVKEMADELREGEPQPNYDEEYQNLRHSMDDKPHYDWDDIEGLEEDCGCINYEEDEDDEEVRNKRMDVIGQNGNEGTHYYKDSDGFEDYQWDGPNNVLIDAKKQYDEQIKQSKKRKAKSVKDWEDNFDLGGQE